SSSIQRTVPSSPLSRACFFYYSTVHVDLRSFPTRRSSDLCASYWDLRNPSGNSAFDPGTSGNSITCNNQTISTGSQTGATAVPTDRKSTRLNSSHVAISYAVFCLKKKAAEVGDQVFGDPAA